MNSIHNLVAAEIHRREAEKKRMDQEEQDHKIGILTEKILTNFSHVLQKFLDNYEDYSGHYLNLHNINLGINLNDSTLLQTLNSIGFDHKMHESSVDSFLSIPDFHTGDQKTTAQEMLCKFQQELEKKRHAREVFLHNECEAVKSLLVSNNFKYDVTTQIITVTSNESFHTEFEKKVVLEFFEKLEIKFHSATNGSWSFTI